MYRNELIYSPVHQCGFVEHAVQFRRLSSRGCHFGDKVRQDLVVDLKTCQGDLQILAIIVCLCSIAGSTSGGESLESCWHGIALSIAFDFTTKDLMGVL